jgi:hypothetical protein
MSTSCCAATFVKSTNNAVHAFSQLSSGSLQMMKGLTSSGPVSAILSLLLGGLHQTAV